MKSTVLLLCLAATTALFASPFSEAEEPAAIVSGPAAAAKLELSGLSIRSDGSIAGTIVNRSGARVEDVDLLVSHTWSWSDERHPGVDDPGRASHLRVANVIPADGSQAFTYAPEPPLPVRSDGTFATTAAVQSFSEVQN